MQEVGTCSDRLLARSEFSGERPYDSSVRALDWTLPTSAESSGDCSRRHRIQKKLEHYAEVLGVPRDTEAWQTFMDLAATAAGRLPQDALENEQLMACLPAFLRTMRGPADR